MDEKTTNSLLQRKLTMKISYERLNQIIEEEVIRFKKLNEDTTINFTEFDNEITRLRGLATDQTVIDNITKSLKSIVGK